MIRLFMPVAGAILWLGTWSLQGQSSAISFGHISVNEGLSQGHISYMLKDSDGFLWIGTQDGLNRYDGYRFRQWYHETGNSNSLSNNYIWCMLEDSRRQLWIGTFGGALCRYNRQTERFESVPLAPFAQATGAGNSVRTLLEYPRGTLWIGADKGLWKIALDDLEHNNTRSLLSGKPREELLNVLALQPLDSGTLLAGTGQGLFRVSTADGTLQRIMVAGAQIDNATSMVLSGENDFWVGSLDGLFHLKYNKTADSFYLHHHFRYKHKENSGLPAKNINTLYLDRNRVLWAGTANGLARLDTRHPNKGFTNFFHTDTDPGSLSNNMIYSILEVEPGLIWVGTREGINYFSNLPPPFQHIRFTEPGKALCSDAVLGMAEDDAGNCWVGTRDGLTRIGHFASGPEFWEFECLTPANTPSMPYHYVVDVIGGKNGSLSVAFRQNGAARLKKDRLGKWIFEKIPLPDNAPATVGINTVLQDRQGATWLASAGLGLIRQRPEAGHFDVFTSAGNVEGCLKHNYVFCLLEDTQNRFWVGTANGGLCLMDREKGRFQCFIFDENDPASISSNMILSMFEDSKRNLWVCTANGLNLMESPGRFRRFSKKDGLPNDVIYGMLEDKEGHFWVSTNRGLSRITYRDNLFRTQNFNSADGLQGEEFNQHAYFKTRDGKLCFGGTGGLTIFDPIDIKPYPHVLPVVFTDFQLFNRPVPLGRSAGFFLEKSINETREIVLPHHQNFIAFEFAALGFSQPENNLYAYKLEGLDADWVMSGSRRFANYPNLQPGNYTFLVKAANHDGVWNKLPRSIQIRVLPPWWRNGWAFLLYVAAVVLAVLGFIRFQVQTVRRIEQAKSEERERFRKRTARDFHDEAGNKITKIALLTEVAKRQANPDTNLPRLLAQIEANLQELRNGMRDFIWVLDPENDNLRDTLMRLKDFANGLFEHIPLQFSFSGPDEDTAQVFLNANQRRHLLLIFKEAMNNCVKYAQATEVTFMAERMNDLIRLSLTDNGTGFDPGEIISGNGLRNMRTRAEKIGGKMVIETRKGQGTRISLEWKITQTGN